MTIPRLCKIAALGPFALAYALCAQPANSQPRPDDQPPGANSTVTADSPQTSPWSLGGYGELLFTTAFYGPDPNVEYNASEYRQTTVDLARIVFTPSYQFNDWASSTAEVELEHGGTGAAMEVEWDEFGEYESEVEKGGEIVVEQAFLQADLANEVAVRVGHLLVPVGTISYYHLPILFSSTHRPESEEHLIPSTWHESGAEVYLNFSGIQATFQVATGLDSTGFSSDGWIGGGTQRRFEEVRSNDFATSLRIDYAGLTGLNFGVSGYTSDTTNNRPKRDMEGTSARVFIADFHLRFEHGPFRLRHLTMLGFLNNADDITEKNGSLSKFLEVPRTPVGSRAYAYYLEAAVDLLGAFRISDRHRLDLFARYDAYDTMWSSPVEGGFDNPLLERRVVTTGINYFPHPRIVLKGEYLSRWINRDDSWNRRQLEVNAALGFVL